MSECAYIYKYKNEKNNIKPKENKDIENNI